MNKKELLAKAKDLKAKINQKKELADIKGFLQENEKKIVELTNGFWGLFVECGKTGNNETQKLRQFTFLFAFVMILIKSSGMPKEVKQDLINQLNNALKENKI